jgi:hypothetical protein
MINSFQYLYLLASRFGLPYLGIILTHSHRYWKELTIQLSIQSIIQSQTIIMLTIEWIFVMTTIIK